MPIIKKGSGYIAGFKLKLLTIYQNISQLNEIYGAEGAKTLMSAHPCRIIYAVSEEDDAKKISEKVGLYHHQIDRFKQDKRTLNVEKQFRK